MPGTQEHSHSPAQSRKASFRSWQRGLSCIRPQPAFPIGCQAIGHPSHAWGALTPLPASQPWLFPQLSTSFLPAPAFRGRLRRHFLQLALGAGILAPAHGTHAEAPPACALGAAGLGA